MPARCRPPAKCRAGTSKSNGKGALLENDREGQINVVADFIAQGVDGIVLAPLDSTALVPSVRDARAPAFRP